MEDPDDAWPGRTRTPWTNPRFPALPSPRSTNGRRAAVEACALLRHRFSLRRLRFAPLRFRFPLLRFRLVKALAAWAMRRPPIRSTAGLAASESTGSVTVQGGMMLDDAGTWARLVATRIPASDEAPAVLTCTLTLYAANGEEVSSATATDGRS